MVVPNSQSKKGWTVHLHEYSMQGLQNPLAYEGKSAASFCLQVAALVPDMFCNFYFAKNQKIANSSATTEAREKNKHRFGILRILEKF